MTRLISLFLLLSVSLMGADPVTRYIKIPEPKPRPSPMWKISVAALAVSTGADIGVTVAKAGPHLPEANPLLRNRDGSVGVKGIAIAGGLTVGVVLLERHYIRKRPKLRKVFSWINFGLAGMHGAFAVHNARTK
jgi:hypothetical protein